ncbi:hypothetical protein L3X65_12250 [Vibrio diabolicus]|uniref:hypothetical protein n=1 Tax=Vibrio diabolicus TaxID=50719 RepID=UPI00211B4C9B|nr:hypothetical protein [Vibrio diabolicus]MCG9229942.1 hypothetical protein [Vibrio diabolicus]MCG9572673.1 hypothetical protein [Vibrio diabolicus]MCG9594711.1 hypothetical protein [Vibrio diabolicus]
MNNKTFLTIHGSVYAAFAIALFVVPSIMWPMYGVEINDKYAYFLSQHTSIFLGGISAVSLLLRNIEHRETIRQLIKALLITNFLGAIITGYAGITGIFVGFGWSDPAFFALLTVLSLLQLKKQSQKHY